MPLQHLSELNPWNETASFKGVIAVRSPKTLLRWQKLPEFDRAFREARTATFRQNVAQLQQASSPAVTTLLKILVDPNAPLAVKALCVLRSGPDEEGHGLRISKRACRSWSASRKGRRRGEMERKVTCRIF
jgi:hypothetical protein